MGLHPAQTRVLTIHTSTPAQKPEVAAAGPPVHFVGFTGVRFLLAWAVLFYHLQLYKQDMGLPTWLANPALNDLGQTAVTCFFSLSGFLITYLLFTEKERKATIDIRAFYLRRVLRIWPVYFLVLGTGLFLWPHLWPFTLHTHTQTLPIGQNLGLLALFIAMLPNVAYVLAPLSFFIPHLWSVGVEEQFYLFWPWLIKNTRRYVWALLAVIAIYLMLKLAVVGLRYRARGTDDYPFWDAVLQLVGVTRFSCMAIGGLGAYAAFYFKEPIKRYFSRTATLAYVAIFLLFIAADGYLPYLKYEVQSLLFVAVLCGMVYEPRLFKWLDAGPLGYLGRISYGLYMFHLVPAAFSMFALLAWVPRLAWGWQHDVLLVVGSTAGAIALSAASYAFVEKPFLALKGRFQRIKAKE